MQTKKQIGQRGKVAEKAVQEILELWNVKKAAFAFERLPDARAARGALKAQVSDFMIGLTTDTGRHFVLLEVKECKHPHRLPRDKVAQLPRIKKWVRACAAGLVLVNHTEIGKWRIVNSLDLESGVPSWDLSAYPTYDTAWAALVTIPIFREFSVDAK